MLCRLFKKACNIDEIKYLLLFFMAIGLCRIFHVPCLFYRITSVPCPTCNMTKAIFAMINGVFHSYIRYNVMALPVASALFVTLCANGFIKYKHILYTYSVIILAVNMIYYLHRLVTKIII